MKRLSLSFASGALFSAGLALSGMTQPRKVRGFLDVFGDWDPSLALVMLGAVAVYALLYRVGLYGGQPWAGGSFQLPATKTLDARLVGGAALFGIGWGLAGLCPGPALAALATGDVRVLSFVAAMLLGMWAMDRVQRQLSDSRERKGARSDAALAS